MSKQIDALIAVALAEEGYLEKRSASQLDDKTANAGSANFTKYWRDMFPSLQGSPWCACFVSWCAAKAEIPQSIVPVFVDCDVGMGWFKVRGKLKTDNPQPGDIVFFGVPGDATHVGIVTYADAEQIYTIEGNTSAGAEVIANGGAVCAKKYLRSNKKILGFGRPDYAEDNEVITYEQFVEYATRYETERAAKGSSAWSDAEGYFKLAKDLGIMDGSMPQSPLTREQAAAILGRMGLLTAETAGDEIAGG